MNVILASSEAVPFCKTGGLADVSGALFKYLRGHCQNLVLFLPFYKAIRGQNLSLEAAGEFSIPVGSRRETAHLYRLRKENNAEVIFIDNQRFFDRDGLYGSSQGDHPDNDERFILFSRAVIEALKALSLKADVIHCHDWQTGLIPCYLKTLYQDDSFFSHTGTVFTIHNMAYQGAFPKETMEKACLPADEFHPEKLEFYGQVSFLKAGLIYSDILTTVSPTYAQEVQNDPQKGRGLEGLLKSRRKDFYGILNGIDTSLWDPSRDHYLDCLYDPKTESLSDVAYAKLENKKRLQKLVGLEADGNTPLFGMVSRLDAQKGIELIIDALTTVFKSQKIQVVILGVGALRYQEVLQKLSEKFPKNLKVLLNFSEPMAHKIYAGSDFFLMPSLFEPCGLGQMIAMRYATLPIVTKTGGLADTVSDKNGFVCEDFSSQALIRAIKKALMAHKDQKLMKSIIARSLKRDFSWDSSIQEYLKIYKKTLEQLTRRSNSMKRSVKTKTNSSRAVRSTTSAVLERPKTQRRPTEDEIRQRAYEIYVRRGEAHGQDVEDWFQAERELTEALNRFGS